MRSARLSSLRNPSFAVTLLALTAVKLSAQTFVGSDNFNDNTLTVQGSNAQASGQWRLSIPNEQNGQTGGAWTETNGRMEYSSSALTSTTGMNRGQLIWVSPSSSVTTVGAAGLNASTPYDSTWKATVDVTNLTSRTGTNYALAGFEIYVTGNVTNPNTSYTALTTTGFYSVMFENFGGTLRERTQWGVLDASTLSATAGTYSNNNIVTGNLGVSSLQLQLSYDGTTRMLTTAFSTDGGASFTTGATLDLAGAQAPTVAPLNGGMGLRFFAASDNNAGDTIAAGTLYYDNLTVSAIPEPSTYAALAGVGVLGLAMWRKKRKATVAP